MTLEICTHVFCPPQSPFYATMLRLQFEALHEHKCDYHIRYWVFTTPQDYAVLGVVNKYCQLQRSVDDRFVDWTLAGALHSVRLVLQDRQHLFRREIGRHVVCKELLSTTKVAWWQDVDIIPGKDCLNTLCRMAHDGSLPALSCPRKILHNKTHAHGMKMLESDSLRLDPDDFEERTARPLGGLMFASADIAAKGFLEHEGGGKFQKPVDGDVFSFSGDVRYRKYWKSRGIEFVPIDLPNLRRVRHEYRHLKQGA